MLGWSERPPLRVPDAVARLGRPCRCRISNVGVRDAPAQRGKRSRSDRGSVVRLRLALGASRRPGEIVGDRVIETRGGAWRRGASGAGPADRRRVGEIIARREVRYARVRLDSKSNARRSPCQPISPSRWLSRSRHGRRRRETPAPCSDNTGSAVIVARHPSFRRRASSVSGAASRSWHFALVGRLRSDVSPFESRG
jgi:hypothetical protein